MLNPTRWQLLLDLTPFSENELPVDSEQQFRWAEDIFGVLPDWLCGGGGAMYPCLSFHNAVGDSVDFIHKRLQENPQLRLYAVKPKGIALDESVYEASVVFCFAAPVTYAGKSAWRYWPVNVCWEWGYPPEQMQCRQILYVALHMGCEVVGVELELNELHFLLESKFISRDMHYLSPVPNTEVPTSAWDATALADAGQAVMGQCESTLSADELKQKIQT